MTQRTVVILPGRSLGPAVPQVLYPMVAAMRRGAESVRVEWQGIDALDDMPLDRIPVWVVDQAEPHLRDLDPKTTLVVGKSLGSFASGLVAALGLPAIWVTPVLVSDEVIDGLRRAPAPFLLAGGTADRLWDSELAGQLTNHVLEIEGADHGLFVPGTLERSAHILGQLATACESFLDEVVWPIDK